jgi:hypothetical protein
VVTGLLHREFRLGARRREQFLITLAYTVMAVALLHETTLQGRALYRRDISMVWLPQVETIVHCVATGSLPLWDPFAGFGRPLAADPRAEIFYPLAWFNLLLAPARYFAVFSVIHLVVAAAGLFGLARRWGFSPAGAFVAGATWMCSGPLFSLVSQWHHLAGAAWLPWVFLAADVALESGQMRHAVAWGAVMALQFFAGSPDLTILALPTLAFFVLARRPGSTLAQTWRARWRSIVIAASLACALAAIQWLPTLDWALRSNRSALTRELRTVWSLHPASLIEVVLPFRWNGTPLTPAAQQAILAGRDSWLFSIFLGPAGLALAAAGLARPGRHRLLLGATLVVATLFSLGPRTPIYDICVAIVLPLRMIRFPVKALVLAAFAWSLLAGQGLDRWTQTNDTPKRRAWLAVTPALVLAAALAGLLALAGGVETFGGIFLSAIEAARPAFLPSLAVSLLVAALISAALLISLLAQTRLLMAPSVWRFGLAALSVTPLLFQHHALHATAPREIFTARPPALPYLDPSPSRRLYAYNYTAPASVRRDTNPGVEEVHRLVVVKEGWTAVETAWLGVLLCLNPPTAARWGLAGSFDMDILGMDATPLARLNHFLREREDTPTHTRLLRMGAVTNALALVPGTWSHDLEPIAALPNVFERPILVYRVPRPLPRAYAVSSARVASDDEALAIFDSPGFDPEREVVLAEGASVPLSSSPTPSTSRIVELLPNRVQIEADMGSSGYVVLVDAYDPGWQATVDGQTVAISRANVAFRAVAVPAGHHVVRFVYRPMELLWGLAMALAGAVAGLLLVYRERVRERSGREA